MTITTRGEDLSLSTGTIITADATAHVKGAWTSLGAAIGHDTRDVIVDVYAPGAGANGLTGGEMGLIDIGVDPAGGTSFSVVIPNLLVSGSIAEGFLPFRYRFPLKITSGSTVAARLQGEVGSRTCYVHCVLASDGGLPTISSVVAAGISDSGVTTGKLVDPGATANTKPTTFVELINSTAAEYHGFILAVIKDSSSLGISTEWLVDLATGGVGVETVILSNAQFNHPGGDEQVLDSPHPFLWNTVASGTRLSMRAQCRTNGTPVRLLEHCALYFGISNDDLPAGGGGGGAYRLLD